MSTAIARVPNPRSNLARPALRIIRFGICVLIALLVLLPLGVAVLGGFKNTPDLVTSPFTWPNPFLLSNYQVVLESQSFWQQLANSTLVMLATATGVVLLASMPAFIFSRLRFRGREFLFNFFTLGLLFPLTVAILPLYITLRQANLVDNLWGIILPQVAFGLPGNILILRGFFAAVPFEIEEAAIIDGCTYFGFFWRVLLPLVRPSLAAVVVLTMVASWNNYFLPLLVLNHENLYTLPLGIMQYQGQFGTEWAKVLAFISLALVPTVIFYLVAERHIVSGLTAGAVKG
jgi:raffinose/stachyose/melibiose transport system permease protein